MRPSVLIVDDHAGFRRFACRLFEEAGFAVVGEASDGRSAVASVHEFQPDLVLLDVMLPDMNGAEVAELLDGLPAVTVLLVSSRRADDLALPELGTRRWFLPKDELSLEKLREIMVPPR